MQPVIERARVYRNARQRVPGTPAAAIGDPLAFHQRLPGYQLTALLDAAGLARELGIGALLLKDETSRLGLPAFKILGASWATFRALDEHVGGFAPWDTLADLAAQLAPHRPLRLAAATDGNHGRAVARMAALLGLDATIYVPDDMAQARRDAIAGEGALVIAVAGTYDDAIARSAADADARCLVISDTSWPGYDRVPRWVIDGYATILAEIDDELALRGEPGPDIVLVQIGVGALAAAVVGHYRAQPAERQPAIAGVEPLHAACMLASIEAGSVVQIPGPHDSIMAGLNCGEPSLIAWPIVSAGADLFIAVDDERSREAMRLLATAGVVSGETGAAGLAGLLELQRGADMQAARDWLGLGPTSRVLLIITEGATDPEAYARIVAG